MLSYVNTTVAEVSTSDLLPLNTCSDAYCSHTVNTTSTLANATPSPGEHDIHEQTKVHLNTVLTVFYSLVYTFGTVGNGLVIFVVLRFPKMKTVTNTYILNLALADTIFLAGLPFSLLSYRLGYWIFGEVMCKLFYCSFGINIFTGVFFICVLSADRYLAVCYPMKLHLRSKMVSYITVGCVWIVSFIVMIPIFLYSSLYGKGKYELCHIKWPENTGPIPGHKAFIWYSFLLAFVIPLALSSVFYIMVVIRLKRVGPANRSREKKKRTRKITIMVLSVIAVYFCCWLPYWVFQAWLVLPADAIADRQPLYVIVLFNALSILAYSNSMLNPILYAFMSENFRRAFTKAFRCACNADWDHFRTEVSSAPGDPNDNSLCSFASCLKNSCCQRKIDQPNVSDTLITRIPFTRKTNGFYTKELEVKNSGHCLASTGVRKTSRSNLSDGGVYVGPD